MSQDLFRTAVAAAVRAPSLHNSQPWCFRLRGEAIDVLADDSRALPASDPTGWALRVACGAAVYNLRLALAVGEAPATVQWRPDPGEPNLMARLTLVVAAPPTPLQVRLFEAVPRRHSNREPFWPQPVPASARTNLVEAARSEQGWLELVSGAAPVGAVAELARTANTILGRDPGYLAELAVWTRVGDDSPDGVPAHAGGPSPQPQDLLPQRVLSGHDRSPYRDYEPEPLVAVLGTAGDLPSDQLVAGQALQCVLLTATDLGLAVSLMSQPIEVPAIREQLRLALGRFGTPQMVMRIGYGEPEFPTPRRDIDDVIVA